MPTVSYRETTVSLSPTCKLSVCAVPSLKLGNAPFFAAAFSFSSFSAFSFSSLSFSFILSLTFLKPSLPLARNPDGFEGRLGADADAVVSLFAARVRVMRVGAGTGV